MKVEELRFGNLVYDTGGKVNTINIEAFKYLLSYGGTDICQVKPIPLTEDWLVKFGFKKSKERNDFFRFKKIIAIIDIDDDVSFYFNDMSNSNTYLGIRKYVHQLQNLVYALIGEELKINP